MLNSKFDVNRIEWLNLVFENRNQQYGAFILRRNAGNYLTKALLIATLFFSGVIVLSAIISYKKEIVDVVVTPRLTPTEYIFDNIPIAPKPTKPIKSIPAIAQPVASGTNFSDTENLPIKVVIDKFGTDILPKVSETNNGNLNTQSNTKTGIGEAISGSSLGETGKGGTGLTSESEVLNSEVVEIMPEFPGGIAAWNKYLAKNLRYPPIAQENGTTGRVTVSFVVEPNGQITNLKVLGSIGDGCDEEALRVIKKSPFWKPGFQNGKSVRVSYIMPIVFAIN